MVKAPSHFPGKLYRGKYCYEHVLVWWIHNKTIPNSDEIIHHLDRNKLNNTIKNLSLQSRSEHAKHHGQEQKSTKFILACTTCKRLFIRSKREVKEGLKFCSRKCIGKFSFSSKRKRSVTATSVIEISKEPLPKVKQFHKIDASTAKLYSKWFPSNDVKVCQCGNTIPNRLTYCSTGCYRKYTNKYSKRDLLSQKSNSELSKKYGVSETAIRKARSKL